MKYIGTILYGIIEIIILISIFNFQATPTESLIITIVVLTYITVRSIGTGLAQSLILVTSALDHEFVKLKTLLGQTEESSSEYREELERKIKNNQTKFYIQLVIVSILYIITIFKLLSLLMS